MHDCEFVNERIDDYLDGVLSDDERSLFEVNAAECDACRTAIDRELSIVGNLRQLGTAANRIAASDVGRPVVQQHRWRIAIVSVAAVIAIAATIAFMSVNYDRNSSTPIVVNSNPSVAENTETNVGERESAIESSSPRARLVTTKSDQLTVQLESANPKVHIFWVYDTVHLASADADEPLNQQTR